MAKEVTLTWLKNGLTIVEDCVLMEETDEWYARTPFGDKIIIQSRFDEFAKKNLVLFANHDETIFGLDPNHIVSIEHR